MHKSLIPHAAREELIASLLQSTPARLAVWRAGTRPRTDVWLRFREDHATAKDAVKSELSDRFLTDFAAANNYPVVQSLALDRHDYIHFPPKGKRCSQETIEQLRLSLDHDQDVQIVVSDGLSARAVEENLPDLLPMLQDGLKLEKISFAHPCFVRLGRVAVADQIAHALNARLAINLIGERPGLSSSCGLSAYLTFNPGPQTISSDRTVVSNIHAGGTPCLEAGAFIVKLAKRILEAKVSGVALQQLG